MLNHLAGGAVLFAALPHEHQSVAAAISQGPEQDRIDDAEDRGVRADPKRKNHDNDSGECRSAEEDAKSEAFWMKLSILIVASGTF